MHILNDTIQYDDAFSKTIIIDINVEESMKANACTLPNVMCLGLCSRDYLKMKNHRDLMHFVCLYTSGYSSIYDDEYECVHYDDDGGDHASHDTRGFANLQTSDYGQLVRL